MMAADDPRHGTPAGYDAHRRDGGPVCGSCRRAAARYEQTLKLERLRGVRRTTSGVGAARRIQALVALGYSFGDIGQAFGLGHDQPRKWALGQDIVRVSTFARIDAVYDALSMTPPPASTPRERRRATYARTVARKHGWVPPLAWDDIDTDDQPLLDYVTYNAEPAQPCNTTGAEYQDIDPVVVHRVLAGQNVPTATHAERVEIVRRWRATGRPVRELALITGWKPERYYTPGSDPAASAPVDTITHDQEGRNVA